jgi:hypothetical protein
MEIIDKIAIVATIIGCLLLLKGLNAFAEILNDQDGAQVKKIRTGFIVCLVAAALDFIPGIAGYILSSIVEFVAVIIMLQAYTALKNSLTFPPQACKGAGTLLIAQALFLPGFLVPVIGIFLFLVAFIFVLSGWSTIMKTNPETGMKQSGEYSPYN